MESPIGSLLHENQFKEISRCPKCRSLFIEDTSCSSCGWQFRFLGENENFYDMKESFRSFHQIWGLYFPSYIKKRKKKAFSLYKQKLHRRALFLLMKKSSHLPPSLPAVHLSLLEFFHIAEELIYHGVFMGPLETEFRKFLSDFQNDWGNLNRIGGKALSLLLWDLEELFETQKYEKKKRPRRFFIFYSLVFLLFIAGMLVWPLWKFFLSHFPTANFLSLSGA